VAVIRMKSERASERAIPGARCIRCLGAAAGTGPSVRRLLHLTTQCATDDERKFYDRFTVLLESRQRATKPRALLLPGFRNRFCVCSVQKTAIQMLNSLLQLLRYNDSSSFSVFFYYSRPHEDYYRCISLL